MVRRCMKGPPQGRAAGRPAPDISVSRTLHVAHWHRLIRRLHAFGWATSFSRWHGHRCLALCSIGCHSASRRLLHVLHAHLMIMHHPIMHLLRAMIHALHVLLTWSWRSWCSLGLWRLHHFHAGRKFIGQHVAGSGHSQPQKSKINC